jgi:predicted nucleic acid-binding protein
LSRAIVDTSVFIAQESGLEPGNLPEKLAVSVITAAELELGVLRAKDPDVLATRVATLSRVRATYPLIPADPEVASCFARIASAELSKGRRLRRHDTWIAATAMRHGAAVLTRDHDFSSFEKVEVIRV